MHIAKTVQNQTGQKRLVALQSHPPVNSATGPKAENLCVEQANYKGLENKDQKRSKSGVTIGVR